MKKSFIRGLWGEYNPGGIGIWERRYKHDNDVKLATLNTYEPNIMVYVFGEDNYKFLVDKGYTCKLVDKKPMLWTLEPHCYRHKMEVWRQGLLDFDEIVFLDWDCVPACPIPNDFWENMSKGQPVQAALYAYRRRRINWREKDKTKIAAATFVYLREKSAGDEIIKIWEELGMPISEETVLMKYVEKINGGWYGVEDYRKKYEPIYHTLFGINEKGENDIPFLNTREPIFYHLNRRRVASLLEIEDKEAVKKRLDDLHRYRKTNKIIHNG